MTALEKIAVEKIWEEIRSLHALCNEESRDWNHVRTEVNRRVTLIGNTLRAIETHQP